MTMHYSFSGSSRVDSATYDPINRVVTCVFPDGVSWEYRGVPPEVWDEFVGASSPGSYIASTLDGYSNGPA